MTVPTTEVWNTTRIDPRWQGTVYADSRQDTDPAQYVDIKLLKEDLRDVVLQQLVPMQRRVDEMYSAYSAVYYTILTVVIIAAVGAVLAGMFYLGREKARQECNERGAPGMGDIK